MKELLWYNCYTVCGASAPQLSNGANGDLFLENLYCTHASQECCSQSPGPGGRPLLTYISSGDTQTLKGRSGSVSCGVTAPFPGSWCIWGFVGALQTSLAGMRFDFKCDFTPPTVLLGLLLCSWSEVSFFGGIPHSHVDGCSAARCNFGIFAGEDEYTSFCSTICSFHCSLECTCTSYTVLYVYCVCVCVCALSHAQFFGTPCTVAHQSPLSIEFSRQE